MLIILKATEVNLPNLYWLVIVSHVSQADTCASTPLFFQT